MKDKLSEILMYFFLGAGDNAAHPKERIDSLAKYLMRRGVTIKTDNNDEDKWIPSNSNIKPKNGQECFVTYVFGDSDMRFYGAARYHACDGNGIVDGPHFSNEGVYGMRVTHWMEIPQVKGARAE